MANTPHDEMYLGNRAARSHYGRYTEWLASQASDRLAQKRAKADALFHRVGIAFAVYGQEEGTARLIPFDIVPRVVPADERSRLHAGLKQRARALNAFIHDIHHDQQILDAGGIYAHIAGIDVVRDDAGEFLLLEENLRVPSGASYMLENRKMMMRLFPELLTSLSALLRALSGSEVHRRVYRNVITPFKVAELLILCDDMPRSVAKERSAETVRRAGEMHAMLHFTRMEDIMMAGVRQFLERFLTRLRDVGDRIASDFLVPPAEALPDTAAYST